MRIFAITKPGIIALGISVGALWTCLGMVAVTNRQASRDEIATVRMLERLLQTRPTPVSAPAPALHPQRATYS